MHGCPDKERGRVTRSRLEIYRELEEIRDRECVRLWRLARRCEKHGVRQSVVQLIRFEAAEIKSMCPENIIFPFRCFRFAFGGKTVYEE